MASLSRTGRLPGLILITLLILGAAACRTSGPDPSSDTGAMALATAAAQANSDLTTSKGQGSLSFVRGHIREDYRLAWAAQAPDRLRLTLTLSAHPVETIAASGEWVSIISHTGRHPPLSAVSTDPDLTSYINLPLRLSDLITLLLGRIPVRPFDRAWFEEGAPHLVRTGKNFSSNTQTLAFDSKGRLVGMALWDNDRTPLFTLDYTAFQTLGASTLPTAMILTDGRGNRMELTLSRIMPNVPVKESVFRLTVPGS